MEIIKINPKNPESEIIEKVTQVLKDDGVLIYPTDTAYGLGSNALSGDAVRKVYEIKGRDFSKPTHVVVRDWEMIEQLCHTNEVARKLYDTFLPGPLTLILAKKPLVPDILTAQLPTLGIRIPKYSITQLLSSLLPFPYTTPSANPSGGITPYTIDQAFSQFTAEQKSLIDLVLDAGKLPGVPPSTIIDCTPRLPKFILSLPKDSGQATPPKILREGPIKQEEIEKILEIKVE